MIRLYRALLRLYPASFRGQWGEEMCAVFAERVAVTRGLPGKARLLAEAVVDVVPNALATHGEILTQDIRYAVRTFRRSPGFVATSVLIVAFGVGANTAAFSVADFVLVRPLPFPEPDRLVRIWERTPGYSRMELSPANYRDWKERSGSFASTAALYPRSVNLVTSGEPRRVEGASVTPDLFEVLGVPALRGRVFASGDATDAEARPVVLSHGLWESEFGGDPDVLGRSIGLDGEPFRVVGVMPESFRFPSRDTRLWMPAVFTEADYLDRADNSLEVVARLAPGVSVRAAQADLSGVAERLEAEYPAENAGTGANVYLLRDDLSRHARLMLLGLEGAALCILLLACANLTNLLLARAAARERELAVRVALGAGRERLVRQMVTEGVFLAGLGGAAGVALAAGAMPFLARLVPTSLPIAEQPTLDARVLAFAFAFTALTALGFAVLPALRTGGRRGFDALRDGARGGGGRRQRLRGALVAVQVASSVVLLVSAGLLSRAMLRLQATDPGFRTEGLVTLRTALPMPQYGATELRHEFYRQVLDDVEALPGVSGAAYTSGLPMVMQGGVWPVVMSGEEAVRDAATSASLRYVTPRFFDVMDIPVTQGRGIAESDDADELWVAVVSESFVRRYWPEENPIGKTFEFAFGERTVVGVASDIRVRGLERPSEPQVWLPYGQVQDSSLLYYTPRDLVVRSDLPTIALLPAVRRIVRRADPEQPISNVRTMTEVVAGEAASRTAQLRVLGALAGIALLLAGIGIHGLLAFTVSLRSREIGVRLALGADPRGVARMVLREGMSLALLGTLPGVLVALLAGRAMGALLLGVRPWDPATISLAVALVLLIALVGSFVPARRAVGVSPVSAMTTE